MLKIYKKIVPIISIYSFITIIIFACLNIKPSGETINTNNEQKQTSENIITKDVITEKDTVLLNSSEDIDITTIQQEYNNNEIIARLEIPNLINTLLAKTTNNEYYLNHSLKKEKDKKGSEFIDYRNNINSKQINIYGHNSRTYDIPFRKLEKFLDEKFFNNNPYIILQTISTKRVYKIMAIKEVSDDNEHMYINYKGQEFIEHMSRLLQDTIYQRNISYDENSNILILQTCSYAHKDSYYVIIAIEI